MAFSIKSFFHLSSFTENSAPSHIIFSGSKYEANVNRENLNIFISCFNSVSFEIEKVKTKFILNKPKIISCCGAVNNSEYIHFKAILNRKFLRLKRPSHSDLLPS